VNTDYGDFLSLGSSLKGGEQRVEEVRVGLLGFEREVGFLKEKVGTVIEDVESGMEERQDIIHKKRLAGSLIELGTRVDDLEARLVLGERPSRSESDSDDEEELGFSESDDGEDDDEESPAMYAGGTLVPPSKLHRNAQRYLYIQHMLKRDDIPDDHPFIVAIDSRLIRIHNTILLDLGTALKAAKTAGEARQGHLIKILRTYATLGESEEAIRTLKEVKKR
jgi:conserved oligomeric Golgi complex subunit 2